MKLDTTYCKFIDNCVSVPLSDKDRDRILDHHLCVGERIRP